MNEKSLLKLEFDKIIDMLANRAVSPMAKQRALNLRPSKDLSDILISQKQTTAATGYILRKGSLPLGGIKDIRAALSRAVVGGMLHIEELMDVGEVLYVCKKVLTYGGEKQSHQSGVHHASGEEHVANDFDEDSLSAYFQGISTVDVLESEIHRCIKSATEIADNASAKLAEIRRNIKISHDRVRESLDKIIRSQTYKSMLQDPIITLRGDRFCVPVKADARGSFPGMVHDQSASGATVFMEPLSVVELNNKIKDLHFEEKREEDRILLKLSGIVASYADVLEANMTLLTHLDFAFAKGELSLHMKASEPRFNDKGYVNIKKGRHPLLNQDTVVPTDIYIGDAFSMLLITGPNTGGKTVTLKTIGLFTFMGQAGLHIPAFDNSELAMFDDVFADIGDEQSIEQSLSTFSSHMTNIVQIMKELSHNTLVLLDELGAGTDPTEGAALAIAILQYLQKIGARTVVTTHYSELKLFALSTKGVENASCEFDVNSLRPTYRLLIGIPGKSNAFAISKRLGLSDDIISDAKEILSHKDIRFEDMITDLEASKKTVLVEQENAERYRREAQALREEVSHQEEKLRTQKEKIIAQAKKEAMQTVSDAKQEAEKIIAQMRKQLQNAGNKELEQARTMMRDALTQVAEGIGPAEEKPFRKIPENLRRGDTVFIHSMNQTGTVSVPPDATGEVHIQAGIMKIKVHVSDLSLEEATPEQKFINKKGSGKVAKSLTISHELDLRGMLPEEATAAAEKYLDDAFLASMTNVTLIHGKGTGVLRNAIHARLKKHPHVKEYRLGKYGEGETGVTVVTLK